MHRYHPLLLEVWRLTSQHVTAELLVRNVQARLEAELPIRGVLLQRLDLERRFLEPVTDAGTLTTPGRRTLGEVELDRLLRFCHEGELRVDGAATLRRTLGWPLGAELTGTLAIGPLAIDATPLGLVVFSVHGRRKVEDTTLRVLKALLEPLAVAVHNDRKQRELATLREALEAENRSLLSRLGRQDIADTVVGAETGLRGVMERVELVARAETPVLILGETGSGKEVVARAVHKGSPRHGGPFLRVNCGAIPPELIDSELFGHERGSFTGAEKLRRGWFERADGGTLFLDEVAELPLAAQVRLLRILQDGVFQRVGGEQSLHVDVRIVAATHRDLQEHVRDGRFRADLWYRIAVFPIYLPPLRERHGDIAQLASHFALRAAQRLGNPPLIPTLADHALLATYAWPGNVRELAAVMERAVILGNGRSLEVATALGVWHVPPAAVPLRSVAPVATNVSEAISTLDAAARRHIEETLRRTHGRVHGPLGAARLLGINAHTLRARMRKLGVDWRAFRAP
ncbi:MAG: sigma 54-interacting transcriptional regulator [Myxococcota bacterium]|mgnify:CR=1 FL=1